VSEALGTQVVSSFVSSQLYHVTIAQMPVVHLLYVSLWIVSRPTLKSRSASLPIVTVSFMEIKR
jgi:hypothetical protein